MEKSITVLGAGMVGVSCALALQRLGADVTLIDRAEPGNETSHGNAGVITRSSLIPLNNPKLWKSLPHYGLNKTAQLRYEIGYMIRNWLWICEYLYNTRHSQFKKTAAALDALIRLSSQTHQQWVNEAGIPHRLRDNGWIHLYRTEKAFKAQAWARRIYEQYEIKYEVMDSVDLHLIEPSLNPIFERAVWIKDTLSVDDPRAMVSAYAKLFTSHGGRFIRKDIRHITKNPSNTWVLQDAMGEEVLSPCLVIALGPWVVDMLLPLGIRIPMVYERGYHVHYSAQTGATLNRPVYDTAGGYVLAPVEEGLRISTGVELADLNAAPSTEQVDMAHAAAKQAFPLGMRINRFPWMGRRPTLPDCRPMIGAVPGQAGLWLAVGHQHTGLNTGPGTALLLAALMSETTPPINPQPFSPGRYL